MTWVYALGCGIALGVFIYLVAALIKPEYFS